MSFVAPLAIVGPRALGIDPSLTLVEFRRLCPVSVPHDVLGAAKEAGRFDEDVGQYIQCRVVEQVTRIRSARVPDASRRPILDMTEEERDAEWAALQKAEDDERAARRAKYEAPCEHGVPNYRCMPCRAAKTAADLVALRGTGPSALEVHAEALRNAGKTRDLPFAIPGSNSTREAP